jgi:hypothetical protein
MVTVDGDWRIIDSAGRLSRALVGVEIHVTDLATNAKLLGVCVNVVHEERVGRVQADSGVIRLEEGSSGVQSCDATEAGAATTVGCLAHVATSLPTQAVSYAMMVRQVASGKNISKMSSACSDDASVAGR